MDILKGQLFNLRGFSACTGSAHPGGLFTGFRGRVGAATGAAQARAVDNAQR